MFVEEEHYPHSTKTLNFVLINTRCQNKTVVHRTHIQFIQNLKENVFAFAIVWK